MDKLVDKDIENFIKKTIVKAGKATLRLFGNSKIKYTKKHSADIVTDADLASNKIIIDAIRKNFPTHGIISEETKDYEMDADYTWIIDPLDGTGNFATKTPLYCIIIALTKKDEVIHSAVYLPYFDELYYASKGKGAFLNNAKIHCNDNAVFNRSHGIGSATIKRKDLYSVLLKSEAETNFVMNDFGSIAINALYVADGRRDWFFSAKYGGVWDYAAVYLILKESGCAVTNIDGKPWSLKDVDMLTANPKMYAEMMKIYKKYK